MKRLIFALLAALLMVSCASLERTVVSPTQATAPSSDKVQARLTEIDPQIKDALAKVKALPSYSAYEASRKATEAEGKKVEATAEWKAYLKLMNEQIYLKKLITK